MRSLEITTCLNVDVVWLLIVTQITRQIALIISILDHHHILLLLMLVLQVVLIGVCLQVFAHCRLENYFVFLFQLLEFRFEHVLHLLHLLG